MQKTKHFIQKSIPAIILLFFCLFLSAQENKEKDNTSLNLEMEEYLEKSSLASFDYNYKESIEFAAKGIVLADKLNDKYYLSLFYNELGTTYDVIEDYKLAKINYKKALKYALESNNDTIQGWLYNNIGNLYSEGLKDIDSALYYYKKSYDIGVKIKDTFEILTPVLNIGWTYIDTKEYDKAYPYLKRSEKFINSKYGDLSSMAQVNYLLGVYHNRKNNVELAQSYLFKSIDYSHQINLWDELSEAYKEYATLASKKGDNKTAYEYLQLHQQYKDSLFTTQKLKEVVVANARFEIEEYQRSLSQSEKLRENQQSVIKKSRQIMYAMIAAALILLMLFFSLYRNYKFRNRALTKLREKNVELTKAKEEAEHFANLKSQFISTVSHELRTPLYGVVGLTTLISEEHPELKSNEYLKSLKFSSDYLLALINNVLQINKIESQGVVLENAPFNLRTLVHEVVNSFHYAVYQHNNKIHIDIDERIPEVFLSDPIRISQILMNLIGNAIKFTEYGNIWVQLQLISQDERKNAIKFIVRDDGIGIPKEKQVEIFEKFVQVKRNDKDYQGTGLGLYIVKRLLSLLGSTIQLNSTTKGAEFEFVLHLEECEPETIPEEVSKFSMHEHRAKKVLIVEDNKINQVVTKRILTKKGYNCDIAENGVEAVRKVKDVTYDLILMDINMPEMDGIEAAKCIRLLKMDLPIIALTAVEEEQIKEDIFNAGMNDFIIKPYDVQQFHQIILKNLYGVPN